MGSFLKFFQEGAVFFVICMHAPRKPPVELASLLSVNESPVAMAILPCIGNRQSNWRVPLGRLSALQQGWLRLLLAGVGQGNCHSYGRFSLSWSCQWYWRVRRGRRHQHQRFSVYIYISVRCSFSVCCRFLKVPSSKFPPSSFTFTFVLP